MTNKTKGKVIKASAVGLDVVPVAIATLCQFPIWIQRDSRSTVSGLFVLMMCLAYVQFYKQLKQLFKSPSAWLMWTIAFVVMIVLRNIIDEMLPVCFVGLVCNTCGEFLYKYGNAVEERPDKPKEPEKEEAETEET